MAVYPLRVNGRVAWRDLLRLLVVREVRVRYARATLGVAWAALVPLVMMLVFTGVGFERLVDDESEFARVPYAVFALTGLVPWMYFAQATGAATSSLASSRDLLRKAAFPLQVIPMSRVLAGLLDLAVGCALLAAIIAWKAPAGTVTATALTVPLILLVQVALMSGLALVLSAANLFFRDVQYLVQVGLLLVMFASSVVYPLSGLDPSVQAVLDWNPVSALMDSYREALLLGRFRFVTLWPAVVGAAVTLGIGWATFAVARSRMAEEA